MAPAVIMLSHWGKPTVIVITIAHYLKTPSWMENCTEFGQWIFRKIIKIVASSCAMLELTFTKFDFGWSSGPDPACGAYSTPQAPSGI